MNNKLLQIILYIFLSCANSYALSNKEYKELLINSTEFQKSEQRLTSAWAAIPEDIKINIKNEQLLWLKDRDVKANNMLATSSASIGHIYSVLNEMRIKELEIALQSKGSLKRPLMKVSNAPNSRVLLKTNEKHTQAIRKILESSDGKTLYTSTFSDIKIWEIATKREVKTIKMSTHGMLYDFCVLNNRLVIALVGDEDIQKETNLRVYDIYDDNAVKVINTKFNGQTNALMNNNSITVLALSDDTKILALLDEKTLHLIDTINWKILSSIATPTHGGENHYIQFSSNGKEIWSAKWGYNIETKKFFNVISDGELLVHKNGKLLFQSSGEANQSSIGIYDFKTKKAERAFNFKDANIPAPVEDLEWLYSYEMSYDGKYISMIGRSNLAGEESGPSLLKLWKLSSTKTDDNSFKMSIDEFDNKVTVVAFSHKDNTLFMGHEDGKLVTVLNSERLQFSNPSSNIKSISITPNENSIHINTNSALRILRYPELKNLALMSREINVKNENIGSIPSMGLLIDVLRTGHLNDSKISVIDEKTGENSVSFEAPPNNDFFTSFAFSKKYNRILLGNCTGNLYVVDLNLKSLLSTKTAGEGGGGFSSCGVWDVFVDKQGEYALTVGQESQAKLWNISNMADLKTIKIQNDNPKGNEDAQTYTGCIVHGTDNFVVGVSNGNVDIINRKSGKLVKRLNGYGPPIFRTSASPDGNYIVSSDYGDEIKIWNAKDYTLLASFHFDYKIKKIEYSDKYIVFISENNSLHYYDPVSSKIIARLFFDDAGNWLVFDSEYRYDTNDMRSDLSFYWIDQRHPLMSINPECYMKEYYEPQLFQKIVLHESLPPVTAISTKNIKQPIVKILSVEQLTDNPDHVKVVIDVSDSVAQDASGKDPMKTRSGINDLSLFRNEQLVSFQEKVDIASDKMKKTIMFSDIKLPHKSNLDSFEFSAYAFNDDNIKSGTSRFKYKLQQPLPTKKGIAYIISVGVNAYDNPELNLKFAVNDAKALNSAVFDKLSSQKEVYNEVIPLTIISDVAQVDESSEKVSIQATKDNIKSVFDILSGKKPSVSNEQLNNSSLPEDKSLASIKNFEKLRTSTPDDLIILSFSSHGYVDEKGIFYILQSDTGSEMKEVLSKAISSDELTEWMRNIDAGEIDMIIDACHSAASVQGSGFKPGPMGSRGLGQLAYNKGMRVLASTNSDSIALEANDIKHGLLTYSLVYEGIVDGKAGLTSKDGNVSIGQWLKYGADRVPSLHAEIETGTFKRDAGNIKARSFAIKPIESTEKQNLSLQHPNLFDFKNGIDDHVLFVRH